MKNIIKLRNVSPKYVWKETIFNINNKVFTKILFEKYFYIFWSSIKDLFTGNNHMFILLIIKYNNGDFSSIGKVQRINQNDLNWYIDFVLETMKFKSEYYNETPIESIIISYGFKKVQIPNKDNLNIPNIPKQSYKNIKLPISMNPMDYGRFIAQSNIESGIRYTLQNENGITIIFDKFEKCNEVEFWKNGISIVKFKDILLNKSRFLRILDSKKIWFENKNQVLFTKEIKTKFISKIKESKNVPPFSFFRTKSILFYRIN